MIEKNIVREKYASMPDSELANFAKEEGYNLTAEGLSLLKDEFIRRKLNTGILDEVEAGKISLQDEALQGTDNQDHFTGHKWSYAFEQKEEGKSNQAIIAGLIEIGLEEPAALLIISDLEMAAKQRLKKAEQENLTGGLIFTCGTAITFLPLSLATNRLTYIIAWSAILFGALIAIKGIFNKSRFKKIIRNINNEVNE